MENSILLLALFGIGGIILSIIIAKFFFKNGLTFWVGVFIIIMVNVTVILLSIDFSKNVVIDKIIGLAALITCALILMKIFDLVIGKALRNISNKIDILARGKLDISVEDAHKNRKSEIGILANSLEKLITSQVESVKIAKLVSNGNLYFNTDTLNTEAELDVALKIMVDKIREISNTIKLSANQVQIGSDEQSGSAQLISQGASEQAASAEEIASAMEEMAINNEQNTDNAQQTNVIAQSVAEKVKIIDRSITDTTKAMKNIADKISVINNIAEKTDILAINAAIEAARAGELGKGFAVVAAEVRDLAEHSQKAADEIGSVTKNSMFQVNESKALIDEVFPQIQKTTSLVNEIAAASLEQSHGISEVNNGIQQLSTVIQQNSSSSEQMAASSEELSAQAVQLNDAISFFKVDINEEDRFAEDEIRKQIERLTTMLTKTVDKKPKNSNSNKINKSIITANEGVNIDLNDADFERY